MKLAEIVNQLHIILPKYTDFFSDTIKVESIKAENKVATIKTTSEHEILPGEAITIVGTYQHNQIKQIIKDGLIYTIEVFSHDITPDYDTIKLDGFTQDQWNDDFKLLKVVDNNIFKIQSSNSGPILTGDEYLLENRVDGINGRYKPTIVNDKTFTITGNFNDGVYSHGAIKAKIRIAGVANIERALEQYTKQQIDNLWLFATVGDATISKNRNTYNDSAGSIASGEDLRSRLIDNFSLFIIKNTKDEIAAVKAIDICRHDLLRPILKSIFGAKFDTGLLNENGFKVLFLGHNSVEYNKATLVYQYNFEYTFDLTNDDAVEEQDTRAFVHIDCIQEIGGINTINSILNFDLR